MARLAATAIESLDAALAADGRRAATRRQRRWALNDLARHTATARGTPVHRLTVADVLAPESIADWLAAAEDGKTRERGAGRSSAAAQRARLASVRALADHVGLPMVPIVSLPRVGRLPGLDRSEAAVAIRILAERRPPPIREEHWIRTTALAALVIDTGARVGELAVVRVADLAFADGGDGGSITVPDRPPGHRLPAETDLYDPAHTRTAEFRASTARLVRSWLDTRARLVATLQGSDPRRLWVAVGAGGDVNGPPGQRAGMPLSSRSLHRSWRRIADLLDQLDVPGVPRRLGGLVTTPERGTP